MNPLIWQFEQYDALNFKIFAESRARFGSYPLPSPQKFQDFPTIWLVDLSTHPGFENILIGRQDTRVVLRSRWETRRERKRVCSISETTFLNSRFLFRENLFGRIIYDTPQTFSQCQNAFEIGSFQCDPRKCYLWQVHLIKLNWYAVIWDCNFAKSALN